MKNVYLGEIDDRSILFKRVLSQLSMLCSLTKMCEWLECLGPQDGQLHQEQGID